MSNAIRYDSLLVHYLARELQERLRARRLRAVRFDSEHRRLVLELDAERLVWELHPVRGWIRVVQAADSPDHADAGGAAASLPTEAVEGWGGRRIATQRRPRVRSVSAPLDERYMEIEIDAGGQDRASRFVVELMTNQWNVLALDSRHRIVSALRTREAGKRPLRPGEPYRPPGGPDAPRREGVDEPIGLDAWTARLRDVPPEDRARAVVRSLAWTSPLNVAAILGAAGDANATAAANDALEEAWRRYVTIAARPDVHPQVLDLGGPTPYPVALPGVSGRSALSLLAAFEAAAAQDAPAGLAPEVREALEARLRQVTRRAERLHAEAEAAPRKAERLRRRADLLMSQLHAVHKGEREVELDDFEGGRVRVTLDPALSPAQNAESMYTRARKRERAAERLPARVRDALAEQNRLESLLESLAEGEGDPEEVTRWVEEVRPDTGAPGQDGERLPYLRFRSSGGLEIRVGRSGRSNDSLTFHHSAPDDVWLHARDSAGAHVILRWGDRDQNPPRRDLVEAAVLAALNSRARTSGTVPVDWTRRKYVRKPRKAPPGAVIPDRVSTVFVEPDPGVAERLRE